MYIHIYRDREREGDLYMYIVHIGAYIGTYIYIYIYTHIDRYR